MKKIFSGLVEMNVKIRLIIGSMISSMIVLLIAFMLIFNNSANDTYPAIPPNDGELPIAPLPTITAPPSDDLPLVRILNEDGSINFANASVPERESWDRPIEIDDIDFWFSELFSYADHVVIAHVENIDRTLDIESCDCCDRELLLRLPKLHVLYSFYGNLDVGDRVLLYDVIRFNNVGTPHSFHFGTLLENNSVAIFFLRNSSQSADLPVYKTGHWPHDFYFGQDGYIASLELNYDDVIIVLERHARERVPRPTEPMLYHNDIFVFFDGSFYGTWSAVYGWRDGAIWVGEYPNQHLIHTTTFGQLFSAQQFNIWEQGATDPFAQPSMITANLYNIILELYADHFVSNREWAWCLRTALSPGASNISLPTIDAWIYFEGTMYQTEYNSYSLVRNLLTISSSHNPNPRAVNEIDVTDEHMSFLKHALHSLGLYNATENIEEVLRVDLHSNGQYQYVITARTPTRDHFYYFVSDAEIAAGYKEYYEIVILVDDINITILHVNYNRNPAGMVGVGRRMTGEGGQWIAGDEYYFGIVVDGIFDVNGDGVMEIFISSLFWEGRAQRMIAYQNGSWETVLRVRSGWGY